MATKSGRKVLFYEKSAVDSAYTLRVQNFIEITLSRTLSEISVFMFHTEIQDGRQKWRESDCCEKLPVTLQTPWGFKILMKSLYLPWSRR